MKRYQEIRKKTIIVDVDGVLAKFVKFFHKKMQELGYKLNPNGFNEWELEEHFFPIKGRNRKKDYINILDKVDFWKNLPVMENSQEVLKKLQNKYKILIVTTPFPAVEENFKRGRLVWLEQYFPFIERDQIMFESDKWNIRADIIIEDKKETVEKFDGMRIVMDTSYNQNIGVKHHRIKNWNEIEEILL